MNPKNNDFDKTIMFSIHEEDRDAQRKELLRKVYEALSE